MSQQQDYAQRPKKRETNPLLLVGLIALLIALFIAAMLFLKNSAPPETLTLPKQVEAPKSTLPTPQEEKWSYIQQLENREVPYDQQSAPLSAENEKRLKAAKAQREAEEQARLKAEAEMKAKAPTSAQTQTKTETETTAPATTSTQEEEPDEIEKLIAQREAEARAREEEARKKKAAEERKAAEAKKQAELKKQQEQQAKKEQPKIVASAAKPNDKPTNQAGRFGLQCGAFKNRAQAENMQARLQMAGFNARINSSSDWNRVVIGPVGDRAATSRAQSNARSVAECVIVSM